MKLGFITMVVGFGFMIAGLFKIVEGKRHYNTLIKIGALIYGISFVILIISL